jgi:predicted RNase H-like nuclease
VDLAWASTNPSGVVVLEGSGFPLRLVEGPETRPDHDAVLDWVAGWLGRPSLAAATAVGIDAPLLGLGGPRGRRACDDEVSRAFGRFHASVHGFSPVRAMLQGFVTALRGRCRRVDLSPARRARPGRPALREVYPNALQIHLFDLDRQPGLRKLPYKRRRFATKREWVDRGLGPFVRECARAIEGRRYVRPDRAWQALVRDVPDPAGAVRALKGLEDRWDALLCALAVALAHLRPGVMRAYTGGPPGAWQEGYILGPELRRRPP